MKLNSEFKLKKFISLELIKIFIVLENGKININKEDEQIEVEGSFNNLYNFLDLENNDNYFRTILNHNIAIGVKIFKEKIILIPEDYNEFNRNRDYFINLKKYKEILKVIKKYSNNNFVKEFILLITLISAIEVCSQPIKNNLLYYSYENKNSDRATLYHESNFQVRLTSEIQKISEAITMIVEKKFDLKEDKYKKPDISIKIDNPNENFNSEDVELLVELKVGVNKTIVERFKEDINKIKDNYDFGLALAFDNYQNIRRDLGLENSSFNLRAGQKKFYLKGKDDIYFVIESKLKNKTEMREYLNKRITQSVKEDTVNLAFYIENKN